MKNKTIYLWNKKKQKYITKGQVYFHLERILKIGKLIYEPNNKGKNNGKKLYGLYLFKNSNTIIFKK